jgi:hypothetical protein
LYEAWLKAKDTPEEVIAYAAFVKFAREECP